MPAEMDVVTPGATGEGVTDMATEADARSEIFESGRGRLLSAGASAHEHFVNYGKILDYAYEADRKMVSLVESLGVRESTSKSGHLGVPIAGSGNAG